MEASVAGESNRRRTSSPKAFDVAHTCHNEKIFNSTQAIISKALTRYDLNWEHVEDVMVCNDDSRFVLSTAQRLQSWNERYVLIANGDERNVSAALSQSLEQHPLFRSIAVRYDKLTWMHVVLRGSKSRGITISEESVTEAELPQYRLNDPTFDHANCDGFAFKAIVVPISAQHACGVIINMNHSTYDAISLSMWLNDFALCLTDRAGERLTLVSYKHFADAYYFGRQSSAAQRSVRFFMKNLLWYVTERKAWWPRQRERGWFIGEPVGWHAGDGGDLCSLDRPAMDPPEECYGSVGFAARVEVTDELHRQYGITTVALFKAAVAIFNVHQTKMNFAVFSSWEVARTFPFLEGNPAYMSLLPNPMAIAGPTGQRVVNRISVKPEQTVLDLLLAVQDDIVLMSKHAHAPLYEIRDKLAEVSSTEADAFMDALHRQMFNWVPDLHTGIAVESDCTPDGNIFKSNLVLRRMHCITRGDCGFAWTGRQISKDAVSFSVRWDDAQLSWREASAAQAEAVACVRWMMAPESWNKCVSRFWREDCESMSKTLQAELVPGDII